MKKILFIDSMPMMGGGQHQLLTLIFNFKKKYPYLEIVVILSKNNKIFSENLKKINIKTYTIDFYDYKHESIIVKYYFSIKNIRKIFTKIKNIILIEKPTILYVGDFKSAVYSTLLNTNNVKKVYSIMSARYYSNHKILDKLILNSMDGLIFNSTYTYKSYKNIINKSIKSLINFSIVEKLQHTLSDVHLTKLQNELLKNKVYLVGFVGRIVPIKRIEDFVEMVRLLNDEGLEISFIIIGAPDEPPEKDLYYQNIIKLINKYKLTNISIIGYKKNIYDYLSIMDCLVLPTKGEGFGRVVIEAIFTKTPIVATTPGGTDEILENGNNGILVNQCNPNELAKGVKSILDKQFIPHYQIPYNMTGEVIIKNEFKFLSTLKTIN